ncbi:hypothetical protein FXV91_06530 [Methanosarcina sp. DH2]|uniref:hypothetical protein n=1 Tax=Methanosarcina sp. DH2 TaxID=2605639 RepID=UPI001E4EE959|nr:hypothetical protein [Methanosarcina sp. DH2]MCC4769869.1 hypothetical protein [Methanosarcina sp. DH2]
MLKRRNIGKWLMLIISVSVFLCVSASADNSKLNDSESDEISDSVKEFANDPLFIAFRGNIPETVDQEWKNSITDCWLNLNRVGPSYSEFDSSIKSVAASDVIIIELGSAYKGEVDNSRINEMYQKIEEYCEKQEGISEIPIVFVWAQDEEDLPLPDYGPQIFEEIKNETGFIATRGTMPVITDAYEKVEWEETAGECIHSFRSELRPYMKSSGGPLTGYGYIYRGYIFVAFDPKSIESVNDSIIDEIYLIIEDHCEHEGVSEAPVVFEWRGDVIEEEGLAESPDEDKEVTDNLTSTYQTPGFTSIMVILGLLSVLVFKRS